MNASRQHKRSEMQIHTLFNRSPLYACQLGGSTSWANDCPPWPEIIPEKITPKTKNPLNTPSRYNSVKCWWGEKCHKNNRVSQCSGLSRDRPEEHGPRGVLRAASCQQRHYVWSIFNVWGTPSLDFNSLLNFQTFEVIKLVSLIPNIESIDFTFNFPPKIRVIQEGRTDRPHCCLQT